MRRLRSLVANENPAFNRFIDRALERHITLVAGEEVSPGLVVRRLVQFGAQDVAVIQHAQAPAIDLVKSAGPV